MKKTKIIIGTDSDGMFSIRKFLAILLICVCCSSGMEAQTTAKCAAITTKGQPCKLTALNGSKYCQFHNPANQCAGITSKGVKCKQQHEKGSLFCRFHQDQAKK